MLATAKARPQTARPAKADATGNARVTLRESLSGRGPRVGDRTLDADPYGRGTRRGRRGARPRTASPIATPPTPADAALSPSPIEEQSRAPVSFSFTPPRAGTVRINAWDTMGSADAERGKEKEEEAKEQATDAGAGVSSPPRSSPSRRRGAPPTPRAPRARRRRARRWKRTRASSPRASARRRRRRSAPSRRGDTDSKRTEGESVHARVSGGGVRRGAGGRGRAPRGWQRLVPPGRRPRRHRDVHGGSGARPGRRRGAAPTARRRVCGSASGPPPNAGERVPVPGREAREGAASPSQGADRPGGPRRRAERLAGAVDPATEPRRDRVSAGARARKAAERTAGSAAGAGRRARRRADAAGGAARRGGGGGGAASEARRLAGIHAHMERAKAAVRVSRK